MFQSAWDFIQHQLATNQVFSGGAVLMVGGAIAAYARNAPANLWQYIRRKIVMELHITQRDDCFEWVVGWLAAQPYTRDVAMSLSVTSDRGSNDSPAPAPVSINSSSNADRTRPRIVLSPSKGEHLMTYRGRLMWISRSDPPPSAGDDYMGYKRETLTILLLTRQRDLARQFIEECRDFSWPPEDDRVSMYRVQYDGWTQFAKRQPRPLSSVVLREGLLADIIADVKRFITRRDWYVDRGVPYRRGYMLYGPPGTGKSSAVIAIASALKMHIAVLNLMTSGLTDDTLIAALSNPPENSLILIEDIDCVFDETRTANDEKKNSITFSGLLNAIDGVSAGEGRILFATTNHIDRIDDALIRPGRIDRRELIDYPTRWQAEQMFVRFYPEASATQQRQFANCVEGSVKVSAAAIQAHLVKYSRCANEAVDNIHEISEPLEVAEVA